MDGKHENHYEDLKLPQTSIFLSQIICGVLSSQCLDDNFHPTNTECYKFNMMLYVSLTFH